MPVGHSTILNRRRFTANIAHSVLLSLIGILLSLLSWLNKAVPISRTNDVNHKNTQENQHDEDQSIIVSARQVQDEVTIAGEQATASASVSKHRPVSVASAKHEPMMVMNPDKPHQPVFKFPMSSFGNQKRSFCPQCYAKYHWLHYNEADDTVICFYCMTDDRRDPQITAYKDDIFTKKGFCNWKKAIDKFEKHDKSVSHRQAIEMVVTLPSTTADVGELISSANTQQKISNQHMLRTILNIIRFLCRQGLLCVVAIMSNRMR